MFPQWLTHMPINRSSSPCGPLHKAAGVSSQQLFFLRASDPREKNVKVTQSCLTLCDLMNYTVYGILQARILEWVVIPLSKGPSQPRDQIHVSRIASGFFSSWATREAQEGAEDDLALEARLHHFYNILMTTSTSSIHMCEYEELGFSGDHPRGWLPPWVCTEAQRQK